MPLNFSAECAETLFKFPRNGPTFGGERSRQCEDRLTQPNQRPVERVESQLAFGGLGDRERSCPDAADPLSKVLIPPSAVGLAHSALPQQKRTSEPH